MIDLHTHTFFSDGELVPSELIRRAEAVGYKAIALTDHADTSNFDFLISRAIRVCNDINKCKDITAIPGVEITHVHPDDIEALTVESRKMGAEIIVVHGETITEPVMPGTNKRALMSDIDILAHPGLISDADAGLAAEKGIYIEITARKGHSITNGHVAAVAKKNGAKMVINTDTHSPSDLITLAYARKVILGAGLTEDDCNEIFSNSMAIVSKISKS